MGSRTPSRVLLAVLAGLDLIVNLFSGRLLEVLSVLLGDSVTVQQILGVHPMLEGLAPLLGFGTALAFLAYLFYGIADQILPARLRHLSRRTGFRLLVAACSTAIGGLLIGTLPGSTIVVLAGPSLYEPLFDLAGATRAWLAFLVLLVTQQSFTWYLVRATDWEQASPQRRARVFVSFFPVSRERAHAIERVFSGRETAVPGSQFMARQALGLRATLPTALLGGIEFVAVLYYPVAEVIALLGILVESAAEFDWLGRLGDWTTDRRLAVEDRLRTLVRAGARSPKGMSSAIILASGLLVSGIVAAYCAGVVVVALGVLTTHPTELSAIATSAVGWDSLVVSAVLLAPLGVAAYSGFYWLRTLDRVPYLLDTYERESTPDRGFQGPRAPLVSRPPAALVPPMSLLAAWGVLVWFPDAMPALARRVLSAAILAGLVLLAWLWSETRRSGPQPIRSDNVVTPVAVSIQAAVTWGVLAPSASVPASTFMQSLVLLLVLVIPFWFYADIERWSRGSDAARRFGYPAYLTAHAATIGSLALAAVERLAAAVALGFAAVLLVYAAIRFAGATGWVDV